MSGAKRRTPYRKKVTQTVLYDFPEPTPTQKIAVVTKPQGTNLLELKSETGEVGMAMLPTKFRKLVWIKRGDFVLATEAGGDYDTAAGTTGKVRFMIDTILYPDQIKHLKEKGLWPAAFEKEEVLPVAVESDDVKPTASKLGSHPMKSTKLQTKFGAGGGASLLMKARNAEGDDDDEAGDSGDEEGSSDSEDVSQAWVQRSRHQNRGLPPSDDEATHEDEEEDEDELDSAGNTKEKDTRVAAIIADLADAHLIDDESDD